MEHEIKYRNIFVEENQERKFNAYIMRLNTKLVKAGLPEISVQKGEETLLTGKDDEGNTVSHQGRYATLSIPFFSGWKPIGKLTSDGMAILSEGQFKVPEHFREEMFCDHCKTHRVKKRLFIMQDAQGNLMRLGSSCVKRFLGYDIRSFMDGVMTLFEDDSAYMGNGTIAFPLVETLALAIETIGEDGEFIKSIMGDESTKEKTLAKLDKGIAPSAEHVEQAKKAIEWLKSQEGESNYILNLQEIVKFDVVTLHNLGLLVSLWSTYEGVMERATMLQAEDTEHFPANVGNRIEITAKVRSVRYSEGYYGTTTILNLESAPYIFVWFASGYRDEFEKGDMLTLKGTIKKFDEFRGYKQTVLTRCKVIE